MNHDLKSFAHAIYLLFIQLNGMHAEDSQLKWNDLFSMFSIKLNTLYFFVIFRNWKTSCEWGSNFFRRPPLGIGDRQFMSQKATTLKKSICYIGMGDMRGSSTSVDCFTIQLSMSFVIDVKFFNFIIWLFLLVIHRQSTFAQNVSNSSKSKRLYNNINCIVKVKLILAT